VCQNQLWNCTGVSRIVGIDLGWRELDDDHIRVAVAYDGMRHDDLIIPIRFWKNAGAHAGK
jgi:hypothetical protein